MQAKKTMKPVRNKPSMRGPAALVQQMILELFTKCSMNVKRLFTLKSAIVYELSKSSDEKTHQLAKELQRKWTLQNIKKNVAASSGGPKQADARKSQSSRGILSQSNSFGQAKVPAKKRQQDENIEPPIVAQNQGISSPISQKPRVSASVIAMEKSAPTPEEDNFPASPPTTIIEKVVESPDDNADDCIFIPRDEEISPRNVSAKMPTKPISKPIDHSEDSSDSIMFIEEVQPTAKSKNLKIPKKSASSLEFSGQFKTETLNNSVERDMERTERRNNLTADAQDKDESNTGDMEIEMPEITPIPEDQISFKKAHDTSSANRNSASFHNPEPSTTRLEDGYWMRCYRSSFYRPRRTVDHSPYYYRRSLNESRRYSHANHDHNDQDQHHWSKKRCFYKDDAMHDHMPRCECLAYHMMKFMNELMSCHHSACGRE